VIIDCAHYKDGSRQNDGPLPIDEAARRREEDDGFVWIGTHEPDPQELHEIAERFDLPQLAVEDAMQAHQRPKLEDYGDVYFLVLHTARYLDDVEEVEFGEVHVFSGPKFVITIRHGAASELQAAREQLESEHPELLDEGPAAAVWAIVDKVVDDYEPVMAGLENDVEEVEVAVFGESSDETRRVYFLRRELAEFYRAVHPLLQPLENLVSSEHPEISARLREHMRDVVDHVKRV
jgi:magnesium transporter